MHEHSPAHDLTGHLEALLSGDPGRSGSAFALLLGLPEPADAALQAAADSPHWTVEQRLHLAYLLLRRGAARPKDRAFVRSQRVVLSGAVPEAVREAIVLGVSIRGMEVGTDIRWMAEAAMLGAVDYVWEEDSPVRAQVPSLRAALEGEGVTTAPATDAEKFLGWEWLSNFLLMPIDGYRIRLSLWGPFASLKDDAPKELVSRCRRAADTAGWLYVEPEVLDVPVLGLVYDAYARRGELTVGEHLYDAGIPVPGRPLPPQFS